MVGRKGIKVRGKEGSIWKLHDQPRPPDLLL